MATNNLATILEQVKMTSNQLAAWSTLNKSTVKSVVMCKRTPAPSTQDRLVRVINARAKTSYKLEDVFPPKKKKY